MNIGTPCKYKGILGRVTKIEGGIVEFSTPHGSTIRSGLAWLNFSLTPEDLVKLAEYTEDARKVLKEKTFLSYSRGF